jgi:hypothetical protein
MDEEGRDELQMNDFKTDRSISAIHAESPFRAKRQGN